MNHNRQTPNSPSLLPTKLGHILQRGPSPSVPTEGQPPQPPASGLGKAKGNLSLTTGMQGEERGCILASKTPSSPPSGPGCRGAASSLSVAVLSGLGSEHTTPRPAPPPAKCSRLKESEEQQQRMTSGLPYPASLPQVTAPHAGGALPVPRRERPHLQRQKDPKGRAHHTPPSSAPPFKPRTKALGLAFSSTKSCKIHCTEDTPASFTC